MPPPPELPPAQPIVAAPLAPLALAPAPTVEIASLTFGAAAEELEPLPLPAGDLWERIVRGYRIPEVQGPLVDKWEEWYSSRPDYVARMVERSRRYLYHIVNEVEMRGMPLDLALLPMVESAYNPHALSVSRASGIWQFMPATGQTYGLKQNWWFDSRRDVLAATSSALDYLGKLESEFGDWQLALAAYNWGEGNVRRAIARNQAQGLPTDFASLTGVPDETRNYLPKLQAVKNIITDPGRYDLSLANVPDAPYFTVVRTSRVMDVKRAAELAEMSPEEFVSLNPQHNRPVIAGADEQAILLPIDKAEVFATKLELTDQPLVSWQAYRYRAGDTLPSVAAKFGMSVETLKTVNGIGPRSYVPVGHTLLVPSQSYERGAGQRLREAVFTSVPEGRTYYHVVRRGETLQRVAARFGVTPEELKRWNDVHGELKSGARLRIIGAAVPPDREAVRSRRHTGQRADAATRKGTSQRAEAVTGKGGNRKAGTRDSAQPGGREAPARAVASKARPDTVQSARGGGAKGRAEAAAKGGGDPAAGNGEASVRPAKATRKPARARKHEAASGGAKVAQGREAAGS